MSRPQPEPLFIVDFTTDRIESGRACQDAPGGVGEAILVPPGENLVIDCGFSPLFGSLDITLPGDHRPESAQCFLRDMRGVAHRQAMAAREGPFALRYPALLARFNSFVLIGGNRQHRRPSLSVDGFAYWGAVELAGIQPAAQEGAAPVDVRLNPPRNTVGITADHLGNALAARIRAVSALSAFPISASASGIVTEVAAGPDGRFAIPSIPVGADDIVAYIERDGLLEALSRVPMPATTDASSLTITLNRIERSDLAVSLSNPRVASGALLLLQAISPLREAPAKSVSELSSMDYSPAIPLSLRAYLDFPTAAPLIIEGVQYATRLVELDVDGRAISKVPLGSYRLCLFAFEADGSTLGPLVTPLASIDSRFIEIAVSLPQTSCTKITFRGRQTSSISAISLRDMNGDRLCILSSSQYANFDPPRRHALQLPFPPSRTLCLQDIPDGNWALEAIAADGGILFSKPLVFPCPSKLSLDCE